MKPESLNTRFLFEGVSELLEDISNQGGRHFLVSHRNNQVLEILEKTSIATYFTEVVTSSSGFKRKPNPESMIYLRENIRLALVLSLVIDQLISKPGKLQD